MPRYVILEHDHPELHWDLMLEVGAVLKTWRLARAPANQEKMEAQPLPDHRVLYLDYEGPVSGGRGTVRRWDSGEYAQLPTKEGETVKVHLAGQKLQAIAVWREGASQWVFECAD